MKQGLDLARIGWGSEQSWIVISLISGIVVSALFIMFNKFQGINEFALVLISTISFYILSILLRIHNKRGMTQSGKTGLTDLDLKVGCPVLGFGLGICLLVIV